MPDISYSIRIVDENGNGIPDEEVTVFYTLSHSKEFTDEDGWVTFEKSNMLSDYADGEVYFRGESLGKISASGDGDTFLFTCNTGDEVEG